MHDDLQSKGLQKLKWYCEMCQKQCRDENGFKCHTTSEGHLRQMRIFSENPHKMVDQFSDEVRGWCRQNTSCDSTDETDETQWAGTVELADCRGWRHHSAEGMKSGTASGRIHGSTVQDEEPSGKQTGRQAG